MAQVLVRNLDTQVVDTLKRRAARRGASLQAELKQILEQAAQGTLVDPEALARRISRRLRDKRIRFRDSGAMQAEDRLR
jgi:plasmid stability protein